MLVYDAIAFSLQQAGGISVLFSELFARLPAGSFEVIGHRQPPPSVIPQASYRHQPPRLFERFRRARVTKGCELFHTTYYRRPDNRDTKVVTTVYDYVYERLAPMHQRVAHTWQKRRTIDASDRVICISENTRRDLVEFMGPSVADRAVVIPLAASAEFRPIPGVTPLAQVLFVGRRVAYKRFLPVVSALSSIPDVQLILAGGGPLTKAEIEVLEAHLPRRYRATGHISNAALNVEYNRSLCLAYPSSYEGFGIPIVEAMQAGCPVIATAGSSINEVAGNAAILLERGDQDEIRLAVESVKISATRNALIAKGRTQAAKFSWDATCRKTIAVYEQLTGKPLIR